MASASFPGSKVSAGNREADDFRRQLQLILVSKGMIKIICIHCKAALVCKKERTVLYVPATIRNKPEIISGRNS